MLRLQLIDSCIYILCFQGLTTYLINLGLEKWCPVFGNNYNVLIPITATDLPSNIFQKMTNPDEP